ncbi:MAG TPA: class I SAM-dependent methyltransferase [Candidatus Bathyarchaeia archaeon]|nr:class I SAM-dependent methyltransferase [Candidatus Bathyarchaeia archaeon]
MHKTIRSLNPKAAHIMDLGCGIGRLAEVLHKKYGYLVTGIDLSRAMALLARQRCPECDFIRMDIRCLGLNMDFDVAICMWTTFNYLSVKEDIAKFFAGVSRSLKASGLLFVDMNNHGLRDKRNYSREARNDSYLVKVEIRKRVVGDLNEGIYYYRIRNLKTGKEISARDQEISKIYTLETIASAACPQFDFLKAYGDYDVSAEYVPSSSDRIIAVFRRNERQLQTETSEEHAHVRQT